MTQIELSSGSAAGTTARRSRRRCPRPPRSTNGCRWPAGQNPQRCAPRDLAQHDSREIAASRERIRERRSTGFSPVGALDRGCRFRGNGRAQMLASLYPPRKASSQRTSGGTSELRRPTARRARVGVARDGVEDKGSRALELPALRGGRSRRNCTRNVFSSPSRPSRDEPGSGSFRGSKRRPAGAASRRALSGGPDLRAAGVCAPRTPRPPSEARNSVRHARRGRFLGCG